MVVMRNNERNTAAAAEQLVYTHNRDILLEAGGVKHPIQSSNKSEAIKTDKYGIPLNYGNYKNGRLMTKKEPSRCSEVGHLMVGPFGINCHTHARHSLTNTWFTYPPEPAREPSAEHCVLASLVSVSTKADPTPFIEVAPTVATNVNLMSLQEVELAVNELISVKKQSPGDSTPNIPPPNC